MVQGSYSLEDVLFRCPFSPIFQSFRSSWFFVFCFIWLRWVFLAARGLYLVAASGGYSHCGAWASHCGGFSCCAARALGAWASVIAARALSSCDLWALECRLSSCGARHVGSSQTRAQTCVPCTGRQILNHRATREVPRSSWFSCT